LGPYILFFIFFSNTVNLHSSLWDHVSCGRKVKTIIYIYIEKKKNSALNHGKHFLNLICSKFDFR
jgi:hypothetical protein